MIRQNSETKPSEIRDTGGSSEGFTREMKLLLTQLYILVDVILLHEFNKEVQHLG